MLIRTWRHLAPCIQTFFAERVENANKRPTEKGRLSALKKAQAHRMSRKGIRECQQISSQGELAHKVITALEQKVKPTLPICQPIVKFVYNRNQKILNNRYPLEVIDGTGKINKMKIQDAEEVVKRTASLFNKELEERFPEVKGNIPEFIAAACLSDPRQKGIDLDKETYETAKKVISNRLQLLMDEHALNPLRPNPNISSEEEDMYAAWDEPESGLEFLEKSEANEEDEAAEIKSEREDTYVPVEPDEIVEEWLEEPRLGLSVSKNLPRRIGYLLDTNKRNKYDLFDYMQQQYEGEQALKVNKKSSVQPTNDEKQVRQLLVTALCSLIGGHISTAIQESVFSLAGAAEGGVCVSRGQSVNLASRVYIVANSAQLSPIKGACQRISTLKRKGVEVKKAGNDESSKKQKTSENVVGM